EDGLNELQVEMIDRFGLLPEPAKHLIRLTLLKLQAEKLGITKIDAGPQGGRIEFAADTPVDPMALIKLIQTQPKRYKFEGATVCNVQVPIERPDERFNTLEALLERLATAECRNATGHYGPGAPSRRAAEPCPVTCVPTCRPAGSCRFPPEPWPEGGNTPMKTASSSCARRIASSRRVVAAPAAIATASR